MCNQTIKENLLVMATPYFNSDVITRDTQKIIRTTIVLACKAIDAYKGNLDELVTLDKILEEYSREARTGK